MTAVSDKVLRAGGPALWFQRPTGYKISALTNLFGTTGRVARPQHFVTDRCHFKPRGYRIRNPTEFAVSLQTRHEVAQISVFHTLKLFGMVFIFLTHQKSSS
jgi:3-polyprenyl-4-hydroxybenzoate decarboxylase